MELDELRREIDAVDAEMRALFARRMEAVRAVAVAKRELGLPVEDSAREAAMEAAAAEGVDEELLPFYLRFLRENVALSKEYQRQLAADEGVIRMALGPASYDIVIERGGLSHVAELFDLDRRVLVVTDDGVPEHYARTVADACATPVLVTLPQGEGSKSPAAVEVLHRTMLGAGFTRGDAVCAVGGGVVGDVAGLAAATYMRGVDFYAVPTTVLAQVDSSIGGKTAVNLDGVKNVVGAFWQPRGVLVDPEVLETLPFRQTANGLAEAVKAALVGDAALFARFEAARRDEAPLSLDDVIPAAIRVKQRIVQADEREQGLRRVLNFGHTVGHGLESAAGLLHGEAVAAGMLAMCGPELRERLRPVLKGLGLPTMVRADLNAVMAAIAHDKKTTADGRIAAVRVDEPGCPRIENLTLDELRALAETVVCA